MSPFSISGYLLDNAMGYFSVMYVIHRRDPFIPGRPVETFNPGPFEQYINRWDSTSSIDSTNSASSPHQLKTWLITRSNGEAIVGDVMNGNDRRIRTPRNMYILVPVQPDIDDDR